jgi:hypothetical protein
MGEDRRRGTPGARRQSCCNCVVVAWDHMSKSRPSEEEGQTVAGLGR